MAARSPLKRSLWRAEYALASFPPVRWLVGAIEWLFAKTLWLWGRIRFAALVPARGLGCVCHWTVELKYPENLRLGDDVIIGVNVTLGAHSMIHIGDRVRISRDVLIETAGLDFVSTQPPYPHLSKPIEIGHSVWIGARAVILGGVRIGAHAVIAAGSVVTGDVAPGTLVAGVPARPVRSLPRSDSASS